jgi:SAM-dependent methyltransferase
MTSIAYPSATLRKETIHTVSLIEPHLRHPGTRVLDVGCGAGYVASELGARSARVTAVDIVDCREVKTCPFHLYDGVHLPFAEGSFDLVLLSFVLHHVPDERKIPLLREAVRVARGKVVLIEDTPRSLWDRLVGKRHAESFRRKIRSSASYGFLTVGEWLWLLRGLGLHIVEARRLGRFCRSFFQPFARSLMVAER